jgi:hypothetical protein
MATFAEQFESKYKKTGTAQNSFASRFESSDSYKRISETSALRQAEIKRQQDEEGKRQALEQAQQLQRQEQQKIEQNKNFIDRIYQKGTEKIPLTTNIMANIGEGIQSFGSKLSNAIMNPARTVEKASNYLKESPFIKEIPGETQDQANERRAKMALGAYGTAGNIVSDIARVPIRTLGNIGATGVQLATGEDVNYTPESPVANWIYGEGLSSFGQKAVKAEKTIADMGGTDFEVKVLPVLGITAGVFTDLYPGGSAEGKLLKQLAKGGVADVVKIVEKNGLKLSEDAIISIAKSQDSKEIKNILEQEAVKLAQEIKTHVLEPRILKQGELAPIVKQIETQTEKLAPSQALEVKTALEQGHSQEAIVKSIQETGGVTPKAPKAPTATPKPSKVETPIQIPKESPTFKDILNDPLFDGKPKPQPNAFQDTLPSKTRPNSIKEIVKTGGNPLYHDTNADGVLGILDSGEIKAHQAPFGQLAGQGKRVSTTRNFDNYSRYHNSPYRFVIDESKTGQRAIPDNREEFESIFKNNVSTKSIKTLAIDITNPELITDIKKGNFDKVIAKAKEKGIKIETFEGKILPDEASNKEIQALTKEEVMSKLYGVQLKNTDLVLTSGKESTVSSMQGKDYSQQNFSTDATSREAKTMAGNKELGAQLYGKRGSYDKSIAENNGIVNQSPSPIQKVEKIEVPKVEPKVAEEVKPEVSQEKVSKIAKTQKNEVSVQEDRLLLELESKREPINNLVNNGVVSIDDVDEIDNSISKLTAGKSLSSEERQQAYEMIQRAKTSEIKKRVVKKQIVTQPKKIPSEIPPARKADIIIKDKLNKTLEEKAGVLNEGIKNAIKKDKIMQDKAKTAIDIIKEDKTAKPELRNWLKNTYIGKIKAQKEAMDFKIKESADNILKHEAGQNYEGRDIVEKKFQDLYDEAEKAGINIVRRENYVPHLYRESYEEIKKAVAKSMEDKGVDKDLIEAYLKGEGLPTEMAKTLKMNPFFTRERSFETYEEAMKYGLTPKYEKISQLVGHYVEKMNEVIANQKLIDDLIASKKLTSKPRYGLKGVDIPNHEGMYFADAKIANHLNDFFRNEDGLNIAQKPLKTLAKLSKGLQNIVLAGGIPKSNANFFVAGFLDKELKTAIGSVATGNIKKAVTHLKVLPTFVRSNFIKPSQKFFEKRLENGTLLRMAGQGIDVSNFVGNYKETNRGFIKFFKNTKAKEILGEGYDRVLGEKTFNSFLPMQTTTLFEDTYKQGIKNGLSEEKASKLAGDTIKNYMGVIDRTVGKTTDDFISAFAFAPKFREGLIKSTWNTVKSIDPRTWKNPAFADNRKLLIGSLLVGFGVYNELNKKLNGHPMSENETGKKLELKIPGKDGKVYYVPFAPSQLAFFRNIAEAGLAVGEGDTKTVRQKIGSNLSMGVKLINDIISNQDYFGNEIYDDQAPLREQARDVVKYLGLNANHPYAKGVWNIVVNKNAEKNPIYPKYKEITDLMAKGQREEADLVIAGLTDSEKKEYEDMKKQKLKPTGQVMSEMLEVPLRFTTQGKIESKKRYEKIDKITREIKATPEDKRIEKIQEIVKNLPEDERKGVVYALGQNGISTKGVSTSETSIRARELAKRWDSLPIKERQRKKIEEIKKDKKFLSAFNQAFEEKDLSQQEIDLKNSTVEERVSYIKNKIKNMDNKEKSLFIAELRKKGIVTDSVFVALRN